MEFQSLLTISTERRGHGRRYSHLPVDSLDEEGFVIDCDGTHMRPEMYDILPGDVVRWRQNGRWQQAQINAVERGTTRIKAVFDAVLTLPPDFFPY